MQGVKAKLAPWDRRIAAAQSRLDVVTAERDLLGQQQLDAQQRLKVGLQLSFSSAGNACITVLNIS